MGEGEGGDGAAHEEGTQGAVGPHEALRLHVVSFLKHRQRGCQFVAGLVPYPTVGEQPPQLLMSNRLVERILDLPAQGDAAAQVGLRRQQRDFSRFRLGRNWESYLVPIP